MTTITIERALLEQVQEFLYRVTHWKGGNHEELTDLHDMKETIKAALVAPATAPDEIERLRKDAERNPMHEGEIQAAWLGHGIEEPMPYTFELGIRSAERFNGIKETP